MTGMNSRIPPLVISTDDLNRIRDEAEKLNISTAECIRRKLMRPALDEEIVELRKLKNFFKRGKNGR